MTRRLDEGRLWFIFNEGEDTVYEELNFGEGMRVYELSARDGETYEVSSTPSVTLSCGDVAVFLQTEKEYPTKNRKVEYSVEVSGLVPFAHRRFVLDYKGIFNEYGDGNIFPDADFSGEISYHAPYSLPCAPRADERYKIRLEGFSASASVEVGGITLPLGMSPMEAFIDGKHLAQCGEMVITVANTALNEIHAKRYVIEAMPEAERGTHYKKKLGEFEKRVPEFKLGRVYVDKITD